MTPGHWTIDFVKPCINSNGIQVYKEFSGITQPPGTCTVYLDLVNQCNIACVFLSSVCLRPFCNKVKVQVFEMIVQFIGLSFALF